MAYLAPDLRGDLRRGGSDQTRHVCLNCSTRWSLITRLRLKSPPAGRYVQRIRISFLCYPCSPLSRDQGGAQDSEGKQVDPGGRVWSSHLPWHTTDSGSTKTPSSRSSAITGGPSSSAIRATRIATCRL